MWYFSRPLKGISVIQLTITDFASFTIMQSEEYHIIGLKTPYQRTQGVKIEDIRWNTEKFVVNPRVLPWSLSYFFFMF